MINIKSIAKFFYTKYIGDSGYKKNVLTMVGARVVAQAIPILLTPLLTRIYSPEEFGIFAVYSTVASFVAMISNGRYCLSIILPKSKDKAETLVLISSLFTIFTGVLFSIILIFIGKNFFSALNIESVIQYTPFLIVTIILVGLYEALFYYGLREKMYRILAVNVIVQASVLIVLRLTSGYMGYTSVGLILSYLGSYLVSYILLLVRSKIQINFKDLKKNSKHLLSEYSNFPRFSLLSDILSTLANNSPNIFLNKIFGSTSAGYFSISDKVLGSPIWFVTSSVGDVFKQEASEQYRNGGSCKTVFTKTSRALFLIGIVPFLLIVLFVPTFVPFLFGENWAPAGEYIRIFSVMYFSSFVVNPVSYIIFIVNKQQYGILFQAIKLISIVAAFGVGFYYQNLTLGLIMWSGLITLTNIVIFLISYKLAKDSKYVEPVEKNIQQN